MGGRFDYGAHPERFPNYNQLDPTYHGKARVQFLRDLGSAVAPFNALAVARWLERRPDVLTVNDAGLESSPWCEAGRKYAPLGTSGVLALKLHSHVANIGDVRNLVIHPASTTHSQLTPEEQLASGVTPGLVRLSVGIKARRDILADLALGFEAIGS